MTSLQDLSDEHESPRLQGRDYARELVRRRDKHTCQMCGKKWEPGTRRFDVHHVNECGMKSQGYDSIYDLRYMITYCHKCHMNLDIVIRKERDKTGNFKHSKEGIKRAAKRKQG
jgi:hypothetical protein